MKKATFLLFFLIPLFSFTQEEAFSKLKKGKLNPIYGSYSEGIIDGYYVYLPRDFVADKSYPVIVFLQGGSGVGGRLSKILAWGMPKLLSDASISFKGVEYLRDSFLVICPHLTAGPFRERQWYLETEGMTEILTEVGSHLPVDRSRIYLTGLSRGGAGTWGLASRMPGVFAAAIPLAGVIQGVTEAKNLFDLPIWVAHNDGDGTIDYSESEKIVARIEKGTGEKFLRIDTPSAYKYDYLNAKRIFTTFDRDNHDAWSGMYDRVECYKWLLQHRLVRE